LLIAPPEKPKNSGSEYGRNSSRQAINVAERRCEERQKIKQRPSVCQACFRDFSYNINRRSETRPAGLKVMSRARSYPIRFEAHAEGWKPGAQGGCAPGKLNQYYETFCPIERLKPGDRSDLSP
jgi:hypothetical protein